ncbi:MAG: hypothetical protein WAK17_21080 [Candidatus Nitrosopolaris sp.]
MQIPESVVKEHLIPKNYEKPKIEIGNYYLGWIDDSYGIYQKEISELKTFLKNAISYFGIIFELLSDLQKSKHVGKRQLHKEFNPFILILHHNKDHIISYDLYMASDGTTFIDRLERIEIQRNEELLKHGRNINGHLTKSRFHLKWNLGELLFNRQILFDT